MKKNLTKFFNLIKKDKQTKFLTIFILIMLFIFTLGYSLSMFNGGSVKDVANIKVNDLSFNMTTNGGTSDDRVLHLQAGKTEQFDIILTNLNNIDVKYEIIYNVCTDINCTSFLDKLPSNVYIYNTSENNKKISGTMTSKNKINASIYTKNNSDSDIYVKLNVNAGYSWNELSLLNQIKSNSNNVDMMNIISYVDGQEVAYLPTSCSYKVTMQVFNNDAEVSSDSLNLTCIIIQINGQ